MIIKIQQTSAYLKPTYSINGDNISFQGDGGTFIPEQPIRIYNNEKEIIGNHRIGKLDNYLPLRHLFGKGKFTRTFELQENNNPIGSITFSDHGYAKYYYIITLVNGDELICYTRSKGSFSYVSIYKGDIQIALLETCLNVYNYIYSHKLYLRDEYSEYAEVLSFFGVYYSRYNYAKRAEYKIGVTTVKAKEYTFSKYNKKYDENWRAKYFPDEDFFGKIS